jgi:eukaryotic-like serine/threonine-protein kinase
MTSTVSHTPTDRQARERIRSRLLDSYEALAPGERLDWTTRHHKLRLVGKGGQGVVYLSERQGCDRFTLPVALKFFSPEHYRDDESYLEDMGRIAHVAGRVAMIQHDNLLDIHNFIEQDGIRIMEMEWVDGYDLRELLSLRMFHMVRGQVTPERWEYINRVIITEGPDQPRLKPGIAIQVLRECLAALAALNRDGIVHGDLKPANIMLKRTGNAKVIDIGSAMDLNNPSARRMWSPVYAAPEVLKGGPNTPQADLASLGYVLIEMLAGRCPFQGSTTYAELIDAKNSLDQRLPALLPQDVSFNDLLLSLCQRLTAPDLKRRFASAHAANLGRKGAAAFHRQLIKGDLASEYENDIRVWLEQLA